MDRPEPAEARPGGVEREVRIDEEPGHPVTDEEAEHGPSHGENDADLGRIVVVLLEPLLGRLGRIVSRDNGECPDQRGQDDQGAVPADDVIPSDCSDEKAYGGKADQDEKGELAFAERELSDHRVAFTRSIRCLSPSSIETSCQE